MCPGLLEWHFSLLFEFIMIPWERPDNLYWSPFYLLLHFLKNVSVKKILKNIETIVLVSLAVVLSVRIFFLPPFTESCTCFCADVIEKEC